MKLKIALSAALAAASLLASLPCEAQVVKRGAKYLLRAKYKVGQTLNYRNVASYNAKGDTSTAGKAISPLVMKVVKISNKGVAEIRFTIGPTTLGGDEISPQDKFTAYLDSVNKQVAGGSPGLQSLTAIRLPESPISLGETWKSKVATQIGEGAPVVLSINYKFGGIKTIAKKQVAVISMTFTGKGVADIKGTGESQVLVSDGTLLSSVYNMKAEFKVQSTSAKADIGFRVTRV